MTVDLDIFLKPSNKWDREYLKAVSNAIRMYQPEEADKIIQQYLSEESQGELNLTNTYARRIFRGALLTAARSVETNLFRKGTIVMWASIVTRDWACCDRAIDFDYDLAKRKIRNAFAGKNFIGVIEPGYYPHEKWGKWRHSRLFNIVSRPHRGVGYQQVKAATPPAGHWVAVLASSGG